MSAIREALQQLALSRVPVSIIGGTVLAVQADDLTCDVRPDSGDADLLAVMLNTGLVPPVGAQVLVGVVENCLTDAFLLATDRVAHYYLATEQDSLLAWGRRLLDELGRLTVPTGTGPSGIPINKPALDQLKLDLDHLFIDVS
jgi:hypothetical protein